MIKAYLSGTKQSCIDLFESITNYKVNPDSSNKRKGDKLAVDTKKIRMDENDLLDQINQLKKINKEYEESLHKKDEKIAWLEKIIKSQESAISLTKNTFGNLLTLSFQYKKD